jgi:VanZ family protein
MSDGMAPHGRIGSRATRRTLVLLAPPLALMGLIFILSAQPDLNSGLGTIDYIGRKLIHMTEYGVLWWLLLRALRFARPGLAAAIALAYAASDEFHQTFVHGRSGSPVDWAIDGAGIAVAWLAWRALARRRERRLDPAALGGDEHGLGAVDRAELAVDVVEMGADRARGE